MAQRNRLDLLLSRTGPTPDAQFSPIGSSRPLSEPVGVC
jgi:hypothetical protein